MIGAARPVAFDLTDDQRAIGEVARDVAQREIAPHIVAWDKGHVFPRELYGKLTAAGLMGMLVPERTAASVPTTCRMRLRSRSSRRSMRVRR